MLLLFNVFNYTSSEFHGLDNWVLRLSLQRLEKENKAEIIDDEDGGVKFF